MARLQLPATIADASAARDPLLWLGGLNLLLLQWAIPLHSCGLLEVLVHYQPRQTQ
jgi:hypothetical protein